MSEVTKKQVMEILKTVTDPELGINIVDLGLVYGVKIKEIPMQVEMSHHFNNDQDYDVDLESLSASSNRKCGVTVVMTLTTPGCPLIGVFEQLVTEAVETLPGVSEVEIDLVWEPAWTPEKMSKEAKVELGFG